MEKLLAANKAPGRREILVATLAHKKAGDNPHLWYNPETVRAVANALTVDLGVVDPCTEQTIRKPGLRSWPR